jgi:formylglycine-generating enzyme required for sulfatase activity
MSEIKHGVALFCQRGRPQPRWQIGRGIALGAMFVLSASSCFASEDRSGSGPTIDWPEKYYNPAPLPDDLILPLPCGGAVTFRPIDIPARDLLDDRRVELGHPATERAYKEGRRFAYIAGVFPVEGQTARRYYLGKYEITRDQYMAVTSDQCPRVSMAGRLPVTDVSWFAAIDFARRWTEWMLKEAREQLPHAGQEPGFLRLPTEEEWEFAARGGLLVSESDFLAVRYPMPSGDIADHAWHQSTNSLHGGELSLVGLLAPNPLGLYDVLGNAAEMALSPFQLDHRGRAHGQMGGFVSRGGDLFTAPNQLVTAARQEHNFFDAATGEALARDTIGFRMVLTAPVIVSAQRLSAIKDAWKSLPAMSTITDAEGAMRALERLAEQAQDTSMRNGLALLKNDLDSAHARVAEAGDRALNALLRMGAYLGKRVVTEYVQALSIERLMAMAEQEFAEFAARSARIPGSDSTVERRREAFAAKTAQWQGKVDAKRADLDGTRAYYSDLAVSLARDWKPEAIAEQLQIVRQEFDVRAQDGLVGYADLFAQHVETYRRTRTADVDGWQEELLDMSGVSRRGANP